MSPFTIALVGRANVGKSSLFNALLGYVRNIVLGEPGTTCDEVYETLHWEIPVRIVDSAGFLEEDRELISRMANKVDAFLWVVEAGTSPTAIERWLAVELEKWRKPVLLVVNKADRKGESDEFFEFGYDVERISAVHRQGLEGVKQWMLEQAKSRSAAVLVQPEVQIAFIGRPNVGKSTLMNRICGAAIAKTSPIAHTTRDPIAWDISFHGRAIRVVDTAGIRRPRADKERVEEFSIQASRRVIRRSDVICLVLKADEPISDQDSRLLDLVAEEGKPTLILFNFWDRVRGEWKKEFFEQPEYSRAVKGFPTLEISARTGKGVASVLDEALFLHDKAGERIPTARLNAMVEKMIAKNPPPFRGKGNFNILYASQVKSRPPTFVFFMNRKESLPQSYQSYLTHELRRTLQLTGQPIRLLFRSKDKTPRASRFSK